ncbi:MAG: hypothetical protein HKL87_06320 [Acidimicrobiaceae bacterium]|nr:hypothetical protein [Acidimicrobiaceae bacterium]
MAGRLVQRSAPILMWSSPLLLLVIVFSMQPKGTPLASAPIRHSPPLASHHQSSNPHSTPTSRMPATSTTQSPTRPKRAIPTTVPVATTVPSTVAVPVTTIPVSESTTLVPRTTVAPPVTSPVTSPVETTVTTLKPTTITHPPSRVVNSAGSSTSESTANVLRGVVSLQSPIVALTLGADQRWTLVSSSPVNANLTCTGQRVSAGAPFLTPGHPCLLTLVSATSQSTSWTLRRG